MGALLLVPAANTAVWWSWAGHEQDLQLLPRIQQILPCELLAILVSVDTFATWLWCQRILAYTDSQSGFYQLVNGAASRPGLNKLVGTIWGELSKQSVHIHFEWVGTLENP